jgi:hypothetical protein
MKKLPHVAVIFDFRYFSVADIEQSATTRRRRLAPARPSRNLRRGAALNVGRKPAHGDAMTAASA